MAIMSNRLDIAHRQWASRPEEQRFLTVDSLLESVRSRRERSTDLDVELADISVRSEDGSMYMLHGRNGDGEVIGEVGHLAFSQLCQRAGASASYLRTLPGEIAQIPLAYSLEHAQREHAKLLIRRTGPETQDVACVSSTSYGRIWDEEVTRLVRDNLIPKGWKQPGASYASSDPKRATTLYASDRDVFIFLVDESRPIEHNGEKLFRGVIVSNSEALTQTFSIMTFLYRFVCDNRNIWGPAEVRELRIRHTANAPGKFRHEALPLLRSYSEGSDRPIKAMLDAAQSNEVGQTKDGVLSWLEDRGFTKALSAGAYASAERDGLNPRSLWGVVQGLTDQAHTIRHTDERVKLERQAGGLLNRAA